MAVFVGGAANFRTKYTVEFVSITGSTTLDSVTINGTEYPFESSLVGTKVKVDEWAVINIKAFTGVVYVNGVVVAEQGDDLYCRYDYVVAGNITISNDNGLVYITEL